jgi:DNA-binding winged helix-turn-helix (wHTH) protein
MARFGPFELDSARRQVLRDGRDLHLTPKAFDLLELLVAAAPRVIPKRELHASLWPRAVVSDAALAGLVKEVRAVLGGHDRDVPTIRTAHRVGYALATPRDDGPTPGASGSTRWLAAGERRFALYDGANVVGRDVGATVFLDDVSVSRRHARIVVAGGKAVLEDLASKNGTYVNDRRLDQPAVLRDAERVRFGDVLVTYRQATSAGPTQSVTWEPPRASLRP